MIFSTYLTKFAAILPAVHISKAVNRRTLRALEAMARRMEPALRDAFLAAVRSARNDSTLSVLESAMATTDPAAAIREATGGLEFRQMRDTLADIVEASGQRATNDLQTITGTTLASFDVVNPHAVQYARTEVGRMIRDITQSTMEGIQNVIGDAVEQGYSPRESARKIQSMIGLTEQQTNWALNYESQLIADGATNVDERVQRYADRLLRQRALTIARSESLRATNAGQQAAWNSAVDQGLLPGDVEQQWMATPGACKQICKPMDGQTAPLNGVFITGDGRRVKKPPETHPSCRCGLALAL